MRIKMIQTVLAAALLMAIKDKVFSGTKALLLTTQAAAVPALGADTLTSSTLPAPRKE